MSDSSAIFPCVLLGLFQEKLALRLAVAHITEGRQSVLFVKKIVSSKMVSIRGDANLSLVSLQFKKHDIRHGYY